VLCGKRLGYIAGIRGFGLRERRHARRCPELMMRMGTSAAKYRASKMAQADDPPTGRRSSLEVGRRSSLEVATSFKKVWSAAWQPLHRRGSDVSIASDVASMPSINKSDVKTDVVKELSGNTEKLVLVIDEQEVASVSLHDIAPASNASGMPTPTSGGQISMRLAEALSTALESGELAKVMDAVAEQNQSDAEALSNLSVADPIIPL